MTRPEVRPVRHEDELRAAMALRTAVFVAEQGIPMGLEVDDHDPIAEHLVVVQDGEVLATARLVHEDDVIKLGRLAVVAHARRRGLARMLLDEAERRARAAGRRRIVLSAQTYARELYRRAGYVELGHPYDEAGIEHVTMERVVGA